MKKMNTKLKFFFSILILIILILSCGKVKDTNKQIKETNKQIEEKTKNIEYQIRGSAEFVSVTLNNESGGTEQFSSVSVPYDYSFNTMKGFLYISAQNKGNRGSVYVAILVDNEVVQSAESSGAYVIATTSYSLK
jgi:hypothetical protein